MLMLPGDLVLDRFEIVNALVRGAERPSTFRVRDLDHDRVAILKLVRTQDTADDPLQDEVELLRSLPAAARDAHIAPLLESGHDDGTLWMLTEDVGEIHVGQHLAQRPDIGMAPWLGFDEVLDLLEAMGSALDFLHRHRVLHLDVKEANIVVDPSAPGPGRYWLVDLGIGRQLREGRSTATADLRGTLEGVAPELLHPSRQVGPAADVYALCAVALRCLRARPQEKWPTVRTDQLETCGLQPADPRHIALLKLLLGGMDERADARPTAARVARKVRAIRQGRIWDPRRLRPLAYVSPVLVAAAAALTWWATAPELYFEDAGEAWGLAVAAPDAGWVSGVEGISSGFHWYPSVIVPPGRGNLLLHLPRGIRYWGETSPDLTDDLLAEFVDGRFRWRTAEFPEASSSLWNVEDLDVDGDGHLDRIGRLLWEGRSAEHFVWFGPEPWKDARRSSGLSPAASCVPRAAADEDNIPGLAVTLPPELGSDRPRVLAMGRADTCMMRWSAGGPTSEAAPDGMEGLMLWFDLQADGRMDFLAGLDDTLLLYTHEGDGSWSSRPIHALVPTYSHPAAADLDGDGDEDVVVMAADRDTLLLLMNDRGVLRQRDVEWMRPLDPDEENWQSMNELLLVDLDADGLPEILAHGCGFPRNGASRPKLWRNLGDWEFERVSLPASLEVPHDASRPLAVDVDQDGLLDLIDTSINDAHLEVPTHRAWHTRSRSRARLWSLDLMTPDGAHLPLGTRVQALGERPWLHVVRDSAPIPFPSWLTGTLAVQLPTGEIHVLEMDEPIRGYREVALERRSPPPLFAAGAEPVVVGESAPDSPRLYYHARRGGLDIRAVGLPGGEIGDELVVVGLDGETRATVGELRVALGCPREDHCLFMEADPGGGLTPLRLDPTTGEVTRSSEPGDMTMAAVVRDDRAWVMGDHELTVRDPEDYALLATSTDFDTSLGECLGLGLSGDQLACVTEPVRRLVLYDAESLVETARYEIPVVHPWSVVPVNGGWALTTEQGLTWVNDDGTREDLRLGEALSLFMSGDVLWAVAQHRAFWIDPSTRRVQGGIVVPGIREAWPTGPEGEHGRR